MIFTETGFFGIDSHLDALFLLVNRHRVKDDLQ
jgi:hypothetical protein